MTGQTSPIYFFEKPALAELASFIDRETLLAFDLDGTLAPIAAHPQSIGIPDDVRIAFAELAASGPVAVITGRARADALLHLRVEPRYLIGNHGVEGLPGWAMREREFIRVTKGWQIQLAHLLQSSGHPGLDIENKGATLSIHYRHAENVLSAREAIDRAVLQLVPPPVQISGKFVESLLPPGAPDKGAALCELMRCENFEKAFFTGDDETDEQVFRLKSENIFSVRVGKSQTSQAGYYVKSQREVKRLLHVLCALLYHEKEVAP